MWNLQLRDLSEPWSTIVNSPRMWSSFYLLLLLYNAKESVRVLEAEDEPLDDSLLRRGVRIYFSAQTTKSEPRVCPLSIHRSRKWKALSLFGTLHLSIELQSPYVKMLAGQNCHRHQTWSRTLVFLVSKSRHGLLILLAILRDHILSHSRIREFGDDRGPLTWTLWHRLHCSVGKFWWETKIVPALSWTKCNIPLVYSTLSEEGLGQLWKR
jgi:hypothetical protein